MRLLELVAVSEDVGSVSGRRDKVERLARLLQGLRPEECDVVAAFLSGSPRQGRIGVGPSALRAAREVPPAAEPSLELAEVDEILGRIGAVAGLGSGAQRGRLLQALLGRATHREQDFLLRLLHGELRQGAQEGVLLEAVARATHLPPERVRRAVMTAGETGAVLRAVLADGEAALRRFVLRPFQPVQPMLADSAPDPAEALAALGEAALEYKLDGARIQVHREGDAVRVYSRQLREVTAAVPEVVEAALRLPARSLILDGEVLALGPGGAPLPFQITMRRFGRKLDAAGLRAELPLSPFLFDCLFLDGSDLTGEPLARRSAVLSQLAGALQVPRLVTASVAGAEEFLARAMSDGHEGVMAKALQAPYAAGSRGGAWLKLKPARTLDLVVLAAEWGSGRRQGWLSNLHLGARDGDSDGAFVMLGKTFKGLTDDMLAWQTERLLQLEVGRDGHTVYVRPELVVEIAFNDVQESPQYPGGLALRFARVKRYRGDKAAGQADTLQGLQRLYQQTTGQAPPPRR